MRKPTQTAHNESRKLPLGFGHDQSNNLDSSMDSCQPYSCTQTTTASSSLSALSTTQSGADIFDWKCLNRWHVFLGNCSLGSQWERFKRVDKGLSVYSARW